MIRNTRGQWKLKTAMRKPAGIISIAFGVPRFAQDEPPGRNEDNLNREDHDDEQQEYDTFDAIYFGLRDRDEAAVDVATGLAHVLQKMANAAARDNEAELEHWWRKGRKLLDSEPPRKGDDDHA
jgi:hypothetical protein